MKNTTRIMATIVSLILSIQISQAATHDEVGSKTVTSVGSQLFDAGTPNEREAIYFRVAEGWQLAPCAFGVMYFDPTTDIGQTWYATLLTAKASNRNLSRVIYDSEIDANGFVICTVSVILEIE